MSEHREESTVGEQQADMVPRTVPELFWRLAYFLFGIVFAGVVGL